MLVFYTPIPQNLRVGLAHATHSVFTNNKTRDSADRREHRVEFEVCNELSSHLPLQILLYFNMFFFPFWWISEVVMLEKKFSILPRYYQCLMLGGMIVISTLEVLRIYLGYVGNLREKVPELAGFWLVSFLFQLPILLFLLTDEGLVILPLERAVHSLYLTFILAEVIASFIALRIMTRKLALKFHLRYFIAGDPASVFGFTNRTVLPVPPARDQPH